MPKETFSLDEFTNWLEVEFQSNHSHAEMVDVHISAIARLLVRKGLVTESELREQLFQELRRMKKQ